MLGLAEKKFTAWRPGARRLAQLYAAVLYNAHVKGFVTGSIYTGNVKALCVPGLNCYSCPGAVGACPLGALQNALAAAGHTAGWYVAGILLLLGITLGRTICGWLCPMGLIQELLHKLPTPKFKKSWVTRALSWLKYGILAVFVLALPLYFGLRLGLPLPAFCKYICPAGTLEGAVSLLSHPNNSGLFAQLGLLFTNKFVILLGIGLLCIFGYRAFCRFLCPLGAIYGLFSHFSLTGVRVDPGLCNGCGACLRQCEMDVRRVGDHECIACGQCVHACAQGAISIQSGRILLKAPEVGPSAPSPQARKRRKAQARAVWGVLAALLLGALVYFNFVDSSAEVPAAAAGPSLPEAAAAQIAGSADFSTSAPIGFEAGQQLQDFSCTLLDGSAFRLADTRGRIVFINQWATYCTPCVEEMAYFERLKEAHPQIEVLAVHHWLEASPKPGPFIESMGWTAWQIHFCVDAPDAPILTAINGGNAMPRTVVLNARGEVVFNEQRSVTYEMLESLLQLAESSTQ